MTSLLERMGIEQPSSGPGPVRNSLNRRSSPYIRPPKGDINAPWSHDLYESNPLSDRISSATSPNPKHKPTLNHPLASKAIREATSPTSQGSGAPLSIKGASGLTRGNVVEVSGLVPGTTAEDVVAIFKCCGPIVSSKLLTSARDTSPVIRITYKTQGAAEDAARRFDKQPADGRVLTVVVVGGASTALAGRLGGGGEDSVAAIIREEGSVDVLMQDATDAPASSGGSKLRSDALVPNDPRAQVLVAPPGTAPGAYTSRGSDIRRGGRRRGRGMGRGGKQ